MAKTRARSTVKNVKQLPSGKWNVQFRRKGLESISRTFTSQKRAEEWAITIEADIINGDLQARVDDLSVPTLREEIEDYLKTVTPTKKGREAELNRGNHLMTLDIATEMLDTHLHKLTDDQIGEFRDARLEQVSNDSVRLELALISVVFNHARKEKRIKQLKPLQNPVSLVSKPKAARGRNRRLEDDEEPYLLAAIAQARNPEANAAVVMAIESAMRKSENLNIEWRLIDLQQGTIMLLDTKNGEDRVVPLSERAIEALKALPQTDERVFHYAKGGMNKAWYNALARARQAYADDCKKKRKKPREGFLVGLRFHDLRHEGTTRLFEDHGLSIMEASSVTGHKDPRMLAHYTHMKNARDISKKMRVKQDAPSPPTADDIVGKLERLAALLEKGLLTPEEFQAQKAKLLAGDGQ